MSNRNTVIINHDATVIINKDITVINNSRITIVDNGNVTIITPNRNPSSSECTTGPSRAHRPALTPRPSTDEVLSAPTLADASRNENNEQDRV